MSDVPRDDFMATPMPGDAERWTEEAIEVFEAIYGLRPLDPSRDGDIKIIAAALARAYETGRRESTNERSSRTFRPRPSKIQ